MQKTTTSPKSMRKDQIEYVRSRAATIFDNKQYELKKKFTTYSVSLSDAEKIKALQDGRFTVDTSEPTSWRTEWYHRISFNDERREVTDYEAYNKAIKPIQEAYTKLVDELMIGDNTQALALLREFEDAKA